MKTQSRFFGALGWDSVARLYLLRFPFVFYSFEALRLRLV
jgi:hypothetical protein